MVRGGDYAQCDKDEKDGEGTNHSVRSTSRMVRKVNYALCDEDEQDGEGSGLLTA